MTVILGSYDAKINVGCLLLRLEIIDSNIGLGMMLIKINVGCLRLRLEMNNSNIRLRMMLKIMSGVCINGPKLITVSFSSV